MPSSHKSALTPRSIDILLFDDFSNHCLANLVEPLRAANRLSGRSLYDWQFCTLDGTGVVSSSGMQVDPHRGLSRAKADMLVVMPSYGVRALERADVVRAVRSACERHPVLAGLDTGSWLLARAGVLDGYRATIHWDEFDRFSEVFPDVVAERARFVIDRDRITCSGAMAAFDLVLHLIGSAHGPLLAMDVARLFMTHAAHPHMPHVPQQVGRTVARAVAHMQSHLETPLPIAEVARAVGCTQKTLEQRVRDAVQVTPQALYRRLRLNHAHTLVCDTDHPIAEIAARCGYETASALSRAFRSAFGQSPTALRQSC